MGKPKQPVISLEAHGTIADTLTYQRRLGQNIVRATPIPAQPNTLEQMYQRWDYQDYIAWWHQLSQADKQEYKTLGGRFHMTGFAYWMRTRLANLADIAGRWRLDERTGNVAHDSSKNLNHATIFGALHVPGIIDYGLYLDGIDDYINIPAHASINDMTQFTYDFLIEYLAYTAWPRIFSKVNKYLYLEADSTFHAYVRAATTHAETIGRVASALPFNTPTKITLTYDDLGDRRIDIRLDGVEIIYLKHQAAVGALLPDNASDLRIGGVPVRYINANIDNFTILNRVLTPAEITARLGRRYPL